MKLHIVKVILVEDVDCLQLQEDEGAGHMSRNMGHTIPPSATSIALHEYGHQSSFTTV